MPLSTPDAAAVLGVSTSQLKNLARATGIRPNRTPIGQFRRSYRFVPSAPHLLALTLVAPLRQSEVREAVGANDATP